MVSKSGFSLLCTIANRLTHRHTMKPWLLYGATGYSGRLILEEALRKGHRPVIAGRNVEKLEALSRQYGLDYLDFELDNPSRLHNMLAPFDLVFHAAPFLFEDWLRISATI